MDADRRDNTLIRFDSGGSNGDAEQHTNALESLHRSLRKIIKTRGSFPSDEAATKLLFLAIHNAGLRWKRPVAWTAAMGQFATLFEERFPASAR